MAKDKDGKRKVAVFRNRATDRPVMVPEDVAAEASRPYRAHRMRMEGAPWAEIASKLGYPTVAAVCAEVRLWRTEAIALVSQWTKQEMLHEEVARLDALQEASWAQAMTGDTRSVMSVLRIIEARADLLGLKQEEATAVQQTVVVTGDTAAYVETLRKAAGSG
jgi:hypothetical protein